METHAWTTSVGLRYYFLSRKNMTTGAQHDSNRRRHVARVIRLNETPGYFGKSPRKRSLQNDNTPGAGVGWGGGGVEED